MGPARRDDWDLPAYLGTDPVTGKRRYATRTVRGGEGKTQRVLSEMVTGADRGLSVRTSATTGELIEAWFEHAASGFSPNPVKETRRSVDRTLLPAVGPCHCRNSGRGPRSPLPAPRRRRGSGRRSARPRPPYGGSTASSVVRWPKEFGGAGSASTWQPRRRRRGRDRCTAPRRAASSGPLASSLWRRARSRTTACSCPMPPNVRAGPRDHRN